MTWKISLQQEIGVDPTPPTTLGRGITKKGSYSWMMAVCVYHIDESVNGVMGDFS